MNTQVVFCCLDCPPKRPFSTSDPLKFHKISSGRLSQNTARLSTVLQLASSNSNRTRHNNNGLVNTVWWLQHRRCMRCEPSWCVEVRYSYHPCCRNTKIIISLEDSIECIQKINYLNIYWFVTLADDSWLRLELRSNLHLQVASQISVFPFKLLSEQKRQARTCVDDVWTMRGTVALRGVKSGFWTNINETQN